MATFRPGDIVEFKDGGLAVVHRMSSEYESLVEVNWIVTPPIRSHRNNGGWCVREEHPEFDMRTLAEKFTKIGELPDEHVREG